jgi:hypothetical protein
MWVLYLNPGRCSGPLFDRHGLPGSVALPQGCAFQAHQSWHPQPEADVQGSFHYEQWIWVVSNSTTTATGAAYTTSLPANGWADLHTRTDKGEYFLSACLGNQYLSVLSTTSQKSVIAGRSISVAPPPGGTVLNIGLFTADDAQERAAFQNLYCKNGSLTAPASP